jgi:hypothetical protein
MCGRDRRRDQVRRSMQRANPRSRQPREDAYQRLMTHADQRWHCRGSPGIGTGRGSRPRRGDPASAHFFGKVFDTVASRELVPPLTAGVLGSSLGSTRCGSSPKTSPCLQPGTSKCLPVRTRPRGRSRQNGTNTVCDVRRLDGRPLGRHETDNPSPGRPAVG